MIKWFCANIIKDQTKSLVEKNNLINNNNIIFRQISEDFYERENNSESSVDSDNDTIIDSGHYRITKTS